MRGGMKSAAVSLGILLSACGGASSPTSSCPAGQISCTGVCVDVQTDSQNCGTCDTICTSGMLCSAGVCSVDKRLACDTGQNLCSGICVDLKTDLTNCGMCGKRCTTPLVCTTGACVDPCAPKITCAGALTCVDVSSDASNCGACGNRCASGMACKMGSCHLQCAVDLPDECPSTGTPQFCANLTTDAMNCGTCGTICNGGQTCISSLCRCPSGLTDVCSGQCVSLASDVTNCGTCGHICSGATPYCGDGQCVTAGTSCATILADNSSAQSGIYFITGGGSSAFPVYCDMTSDGGGWTLIMKIDGTKTTFGYPSAYWTNTTVYQDNFPDLDGNEAKLASYSTVRVDQVRVGMLDGGTMRFVKFPLHATSFYAAISPGTQVTTTLGRTTWEGLLASPSLQPNCNSEGLNATCGASPEKARIGIVSNQESDCNSCDSVLGIGITGNACTNDNPNNSCGDEAGSGCSPDHGDKHTETFGYVFVRENCSQVCNGACVDTTRDPNNCGSCGHQCMGGTSFCSSSACQSFDTSGLIGSWKFNEGSGTGATDSSLSANSGTLHGTSWVTGKLGEALSFNGTSDYVMTANLVQNAVTAYSISAWFKTTATGQQAIFANRGPSSTMTTGRSLTLEMGQPGGAGHIQWLAEFDGWGIGIQSSATYNDGAWHHAVGTWAAVAGTALDFSQFKLYIDGAAASTSNLTINCNCGGITSPLTGLGGAQIGTSLPWGAYFNGLLDEVTAWNRALSASDAATLYSGGTGISLP